MSSAIDAQQAATRSRGRALLWLGIAACVLAIGSVSLQVHLGILITPWYAAGLTTLGAVLVAWSVAQRRSLVRIFVLALVMAMAGFQWLLLLSLTSLPLYTGPAREGHTLPSFQTVQADGRPFTDDNLRDGTPSLLVFFRGRW